MTDLAHQYMSHPRGQSAQEQAHLLPTKDTLTALKSDVTFESACLELCDNSLDAWKRTSDRSDSGVINISVNEHDDQTELIIQDNTGGIPREQASMLFGLGRTAKTESSGAIGTFGVGAKKSLVNLGIPFQVTSRAIGESTEWTYRITEDWFERERDWSVPIYDSNRLSPGMTEIRIENLNYQWNKDIANQLRKRLGEAYNIFLSDTMQDLCRTDYDLTIIVDGEAVDAEGAPDWSYTQFDGLYPRRYENIQISGPELDEPVKLQITVGLLTKKNGTTAGTDIYCQGRKVVSALRNNVGGFDNGANRLGVFNARHERLKVIVELETTGDGRQLPWDTQKSAIDRHNPIMQGTDDSRGAYNWLRRTVQPYFDANADRVPRSVVEPYKRNHEKAANSGKPVRHDFSDRQRVNSKYRPNEGLEEIKALQQYVDAHSILGIRSTAGINDGQVPAYRSQLATEISSPIEDLIQVGATPSDEALIEPYRIRGQINKLARIHLENGIHCPEYLANWQKPSYNAFFEQHSSDTIPSKSTIPDEIPLTLEDIATASDYTASASKDELQLYSSQTIPDKDADAESAELFLVFNDGSEGERGAKVLDMTRRNLCRLLNIESNAGDDIVWEHIRHNLMQTLSDD